MDLCSIMIDNKSHLHKTSFNKGEPMSVSRTAAYLLAAVTAGCSLAASANGEVNVYSYRQDFLIKPLFEAFTKETGIDVNVVFAKEGLIERLKQEGRNSPADLLLTTEIGSLQDAVEAGVTQPVTTETLEQNIPAQFRDPEGDWYGLTQRARIVVASKERVPEGDIKTYEDLADPKWKGRICTRSGKHVYMIGLTASMIAHHGEEKAGAWLQGLKDNLARKPQGNDRSQVKSIKEGECDIALINSYYMGAMLADPEQKEWADSVYMLFPNQEERGTHVNISGVALTQSAPNKDNAIKLLEFLSSDDAQRIYAEQNYEYPVKPGVAWSGLLQSWGDFKADPLPLSQVADLREAAIKLTDRIGYDD